MGMAEIKAMGIKDRLEEVALVKLEVGNNTYIAKAPTGTALTAAAWRCQKIAVSGSFTQITWASGLQAPGASGANLAGLTYA